MQEVETFLSRHSQNARLPIRLISPTFGQLSPNVLDTYGPSHRKPHYFLILMLEGVAKHSIDLQLVEVTNNELLFILPNQIHQLPTSKQATRYFKLGFDDHCLSMLPRHYPFLVNPYNQQKIQLGTAVVKRLASIFEMLQSMDSNPDLVLAHLNSLLTEINAAYFPKGSFHTDESLSRYARFKRYVEDNLTSHPSVQQIASALALNTNGLYNLVKQYSGISPKQFITNRLMLEAKRRLCYSEIASIKALAYELGFSDPEYFSRQFKKVTGRSIAGFIQDLSGS